MKRCKCWTATLAFAAATLIGCESQRVLLGRGDDSSTSSPGTTSEELTASTTGVATLDDSRVSTIPSSEVSSGFSGDFCDAAFGECQDASAGLRCSDVLILCRFALPDGGPPCDALFTKCTEAGYPAPDCQHASDTCEQEGRVMLGPEVDSTLN